jgi:hypothetical protein
MLTFKLRRSSTSDYRLLIFIVGFASCSLWLFNRPFVKANRSEKVCVDYEPQCACARVLADNYMLCNNFANAADLNKSMLERRVKTDIDVLVLMPASQSVVYEHVSLLHRVKPTKRIELINFCAFQADKDPLCDYYVEAALANESCTPVDMKIAESSLDLLLPLATKHQYVSLSENCNMSILMRHGPIRLFDSVKSELALEYNDEKKQICPLMFANLHIERLKVSANRFEFIQINAESINTTIKSLALSDFKSNLTLDKLVFEKLEIVDLQQADSSLIITPNAFSNLTRLNTIRLPNDFLVNHQRFEWLENLRAFNGLSSNVLFIYFNSINYKYSSQKLNLFKKFPHERLVYPILYESHESAARRTIKCSTTIRHLLRNWRLYEPMSTTSNKILIEDCLMANNDAERRESIANDSSLNRLELSEHPEQTAYELGFIRKIFHYFIKLW